MKKIILLFIFLFFIQAQIYVDPTSSAPSEDGTISNPFKSFSGAYAVAKAAASANSIIIRSTISDMINDILIDFPLTIQYF